MKIIIIKYGEPIKGDSNCIALYQDRWDDFGFRTAFDAYYFDDNSQQIKLGWVKIGKMGLREGDIVANILPRESESLDEETFSLGQGREYYEAIASLKESTRDNILTSLNDIAYNLALFDLVKNEPATEISLLRYINTFTIRDQFHRIAWGGAALTRYAFSYTPSGYTNPLLKIKVVPNSKPPTNIHVLIGRNGTGKTTLLRDIVRALYCDDGSSGKFEYENGLIGSVAQSEKIANVICVSFSPFDTFPKYEDELISENNALPYSYIGLDITTNDISDTLAEQLVNAIVECKGNIYKLKLLKHAMENLKSDPAFICSGVDELLETEATSRNEALDFFKALSSGHKMVLLIVLCCVEKIEERSFLIIDEPENHLHPPLLSALIRTLSDLLTDRNGVGLIATHSPVILQEVPRSCATTLRRSGQTILSDRPGIETFGSNVGLLTSEVFGFEVAKSGYIKLLGDAVNRGLSYEEIYDEFGGHLGIEAQIILRSLVRARDER